MDDHEPYHTAFDNPALTCLSCGRSFAQSNAYSNHTRSCRLGKKRMASALEVIQEAYRRKKKSRLDGILASSQPLVLQCDQRVPEPTIERIPNIAEVDSEAEGSLSLAKRRTRRENVLPPLRYRNQQPTAPSSLPPATEPLQAETIPSHSFLTTVNPPRQILKSRCNIFGLFRQYHAASFPAHDPDTEIEPTDLSDVASDHSDEAVPIPASLFQPYPNQSAFLLGEWYWNEGSQKTKEDFKKLIDIVGDQAFSPADVRDVPWNFLNKRLGECPDSEDMWLDEPDAGWIETTITLSFPFHKKTHNPGLHQYTFPPFYHRSIVSVLREKMANPHDFQHFHLEPYEFRWRRRGMSDAESTKVYGELYTSPAFLEAHEEIQTSAGEPGCSLPRVLVGLMFGSDSTHLTSFGSASLWPCYMYFGNESKYRRCKPTCNLCNHIAYFHKLPPEFKDFATSHTGGKGPSQAFMTHSQRELFHAQWKELLGDDFLQAYEHGVVIQCCDGIKRRFYFRIFAYSADYPEKILLSSIRNMGSCPCPRCLIPKDRVHQVGTRRDKSQRSSLARVDNLMYKAKISSAREMIYEKNLAVDSAAVERLLKPQSLVPTENAFSVKLSRFGFNLFSIFLVDFMHEIELGVWRKVFIHLLRILECVDGAINKLDQRFRDVPTFGRDSIRRFTNSVSELKKLAARDYENLLQCSIPVFEGLLPEPHNKRLMVLLFTLAHWHALAKLRQHTDLSLDILESTTNQLAELLRDFQEKTCPAFDTQELKREATARERRMAKKSAANKPTAESASVSVGSNTVAVGRRYKTLNLNTYKDHSLGDYVATIRRNGTIDSYSTEPMELEHRSPKSRYLRTSRKNFEKQLTQIERRQARIRRIRQKFNEADKVQTVLKHEKGPESSACDYHIGKTQNHPFNLDVFARESRYDPAAKDFVKNLKEHLLDRICSKLQISKENFGSGINAMEEAQNSVLIKDNRLYNHKLARFYYTTYDVRRSEDIINPRTSHCNIMLLSDLETGNNPDSDALNAHPFLYARVIGIYHVNIIYTGPGMTGYEAMRFDFLHVRWFQLDVTGPHSGWTSSRLDRLSFPPMAEQGSFGFVDPSLVLRGCHLIQAFSLGKSHPDGIGLSSISKDGQDWISYDVNRFADRDMLMRYHWGLGVGHSYSHDCDHRSQQSYMPPEVDEHGEEDQRVENERGEEEKQRGEDDQGKQDEQDEQGDDLELGFVEHDGYDVEFDGRNSDSGADENGGEDGPEEDDEDDLILDTYNPD
ncbi:hypothetical protein BJ912DRAFT_869512 [Pholiota molesta]|nr:hypothetical protein BJ912DRAFT_869512 [Pholiota molesta]